MNLDDRVNEIIKNYSLKKIKKSPIQNGDWRFLRDNTKNIYADGSFLMRLYQNKENLNFLLLMNYKKKLYQIEGTDGLEIVNKFEKIHNP